MSAQKRTLSLVAVVLSEHGILELELSRNLEQAPPFQKGKAFLLTVGAFLLTVSFFAYSPLRCFLDALAHC